MGLAVAIPLVASAAAGDRFANRAASLRLTTVVVVALASCQVLDFYGALRRNTVGITGPLDAFATPAGAWHPPVPALFTFILFALGIAGSALLLRLVASASPSGQNPAIRLRSPG